MAVPREIKRGRLSLSWFAASSYAVVASLVASFTTDAENYANLGHTRGFYVFTADNKHQALLLGRAWTSWLIALLWLLRGGIILLIIMERDVGCWGGEMGWVEYYREDEDFQRCNSLLRLNELWKRKILLLLYKIKLFPGPECWWVIFDVIYMIYDNYIISSYSICFTHLIFRICQNW